MTPTMEQRLVSGFRGVALLACSMAALDSFLLDTSSGLARAAFLSAFLLFAAGFWVATRGVSGSFPGARAVPALLAQLPACAAVPEVLFILAFEGPLVLAGRRLVAWLALQALVTVGVLGARAGRIFVEVPEYAHLSAAAAVGLHVFYWLAWQLVIGSASVLAAHALRSRRELLRLNTELRATEDLLAEGARSAERLRLWREIDEATGHRLAELILQLELAAQRARPPADLALRSAQAFSRRLLADVREILGDVRPEPGGARVDLGAAVRTLAAGIAGPSLHLSLPERLVVSPIAAHVAFRCAQEAVTNTLRHSAARNVWIDLRSAPGSLELDVRDDGRGAAELRAGNGLLGMRDRVEEAGGQLRIETALRTGFALSVVLPLGNSPEPAVPSSEAAP